MKPSELQIIEIKLYESNNSLYFTRFKEMPKNTFKQCEDAILEGRRIIKYFKKQDQDYGGDAGHSYQSERCQR